MLVVKVLMWPFGDHTKEELLSVATITNVGREGGPSQDVRKYKVVLHKDVRFNRANLEAPEEIKSPDRRNVWRRGGVAGHRPGKRGVWDLIGAALQGMLSLRLEGYRTWTGDSDPEEPLPAPTITDADHTFAVRVAQRLGIAVPEGDPSWWRMVREGMAKSVSVEQAARAWDTARRNRELWQIASAMLQATGAQQSAREHALDDLGDAREEGLPPGPFYDLPMDPALFEAWKHLGARIGTWRRRVEGQAGIAQNPMQIPEDQMRQSVQHMINERKYLFAELNEIKDQITRLCAANAEYIKRHRREE